MEIREKLLLLGPNRRSEQTILEQQFVLASTELDVLAVRLPAICAQLAETPPFSAGGFEGLIQPAPGAGEQALAGFARVFNAMALALQQAAGHRVTQCGFAPDSAGHGVWAWFEHEHEEVAERASDLALCWLAELEPTLATPGTDDEQIVDSASRYREFLPFAKDLVLPRDAAAIIAAAARLDIPCMKLDRAPFQAPVGKFRVRMNGMLKLGHGAHQNIIDGTFCQTRNANLTPLLRDRVALRRELSRLRVPLPACDPEPGNCIMSRKAVRAAEHLGFPVVVKAGVRACPAGVFLDLNSAEDVRAAVEKARHLASHVSVESMVAGQSCKLLVVNHALLGAFASGQEIPVARVHSSIVDLACRVSRELGTGMLLLDIASTDYGRPLEETQGAVVDCDLAPQLESLIPAGSGPPGGGSGSIEHFPQLESLIPAGSGLLDRVAEEFVRWMYPAGAAARIPVIAVTGTNGKTTTCHMVERILQAAGYRTGVVCSDGIFIDQQFTSDRGEMGPGAHHGMLEVETVDAVVLEEYFGRILRGGFAFDWCDVSVCTNVTNDHLGRIGVHTLQEMADVKFEVVRRARGTAVLNAEDPFCLAMAKQAKAKRICLVSTVDAAEKLSGMLERVSGRCVAENQGGRPFIVIYDGVERIPVIAIDDIPATFAGAAGHNVSNAMHAAAAGYFSGVSASTIADALRSFEMSFESTPGRLNIFDGLPFRVIMDYAHNADGFRRICALVDRLPVNGEKILMVGYSGDRQDVDIEAAASVLSGHFDHYICRNFKTLRDRLPLEIPALLKEGLVSAGTSRSAISIVPDADQAVQSSLERAKPGDLVVLLAGSTEFQRVWDLLRSMADAS